jgi:2,3-dimethylmalate lyase
MSSADWESNEQEEAVMRMTTKLRERLGRREILVAPGAHDALVAKIIKRAGFEALYMTGAGVAYTTLGKPDIGLITLSEMVQKASYICEAAEMPVIADGDTGYGNALNVKRAIREYERAGVACIQLEDQVMPKRCGHMAGKALVQAEEMVGKIKAACDARNDADFLVMARTDARAVEGLQNAMERAHLYREAGADILFIEAPQSSDEMKEICLEFRDTPLLANMVEGGKTPLHSAKDLEAMGYRIVIYPGAACRVIAKALTDLMDEIKRTGTTQGYLDHMYIFGELNEILDLDRIREDEKKYLPRK